MFYAVSCGDALHIIPAGAHEESEDGSLVVQGRENHSYGPTDWDLVIWAESKEALMELVGRVRLAPRLRD
jgi:hypothetical protein